MQYLPMKDRETIRKQIVDLYNNKHYNYSQIAKICNVTINTVKIWAQRQHVSNMLCEKKSIDDDLIHFIYQKAESKMKGDNVGSCREICEEVKEKFDKEISMSTVGRYLKKYAKEKERNNNHKKDIMKRNIIKKKISKGFCTITYIGKKKCREKISNNVQTK